MGNFIPLYTQAQREALALAWVDTNMTARRVAEVAAAGQLDWHGERLEPFKANPRTIASYGAALRRQRKGQLKSGLTDVPARDAVETLRRRLISLADHELKRLEHRQNPRVRPKNPPSAEEIRAVARCVREVAAIPGLTEPRTVAPGEKLPGEANKHAAGKRGEQGLAAEVLTAHRQSRRGPTPDSSPSEAETERIEASEAGHERTTHEQGSEDGSPGAWVSSEVGLIAG